MKSNDIAPDKTNERIVNFLLQEYSSLENHLYHNLDVNDSRMKFFHS